MECGELIIQYLISLQAIFRKNTKEGKYTLSQVLILAIIPDNGMDMTTLSERIGVDNSTTTRLIGGMIQKGLIQKKKGVNDKRTTIITLTEKGELASEKIESKIDHIGEEIFNHIPFESQENIKEALISFNWSLIKYNSSN
tara:strand:- start:970 stop:1392 length:423 start_codon:yes stop_codon:yes gene_type:complete